MDNFIALPSAGEPGSAVGNWGAILFMIVFAMAGIYLIYRAVKICRGHMKEHPGPRYTGRDKHHR